MLTYEVESPAHAFQRIAAQGKRKLRSIRYLEPARLAQAETEQALYPSDEQGHDTGLIKCERRIIWAKGMIGQITINLPSRMERSPYPERPTPTLIRRHNQ